MIRLKLEPVPYRYEETIYLYWEYELDSPYELCFMPFNILNSFLRESVKREAEIAESINIVFEDGRIKVWLPVSTYSEWLFRKVEDVLRERIKILLEEVMF